MDTVDSAKKQPDLDPSHELPKPHDMELPKPHDMQLKPHLTHRHSWLHWMPAILGLFIGISVGIFFTKDASEYREQINKYYTPSKTQNISPTYSPDNPEGRFCGGIDAGNPKNQCPEGYYCQLDDDYPDASDASGICVEGKSEN